MKNILKIMHNFLVIPMWVQNFLLTFQIIIRLDPNIDRYRLLYVPCINSCIIGHWRKISSSRLKNVQDTHLQD